MFPKLAAVLLILVVASSAHAAVVTYTLSLDEGINGQCQANRFAIYATVSQGDNFGLQIFAVKVTPDSEGGAVLNSFINRSPRGTFDVDTGDPDYDPLLNYPTKYAGFADLHVAEFVSGVVAGAQRMNDPDHLRRAGSGQTSGNMAEPHPAPTRRVSYLPYQPAGNTDVLYGASGGPLPPGSLRLATGAWSGPILPFFDPDDQVNRADVWVDSTLTDTIAADLIYQTYDYCLFLPEPSAMLLSLALSLGFLRRPLRARGIIAPDAEGHFNSAHQRCSRPARVLPGGGVCFQ